MSTTRKMLHDRVAETTSIIQAHASNMRGIERDLRDALAEQAEAIAALRAIAPESETLTWAEDRRDEVIDAGWVAS